MSCGRSCHGCEHNKSDGCSMPYSDRVMRTTYDDHDNVIGCDFSHIPIGETVETVNYGKVKRKKS